MYFIESGDESERDDVVMETHMSPQDRGEVQRAKVSQSDCKGPNVGG